MRRALVLARRRLIAAPALAAVALLLAGCGSTAKAPSEGAARVVPAGALAYVNLTLDRADGAVTAMKASVDGLPGYAALGRELEHRLSAITGTHFSTQIEPWLGPEVSLAFVPEGASADELIVLGVKDRAKARSFVSAVSGAAAARLVDGYVVVGEPAAVAAAGRGKPLAAVAAFRRAQAAAPRNRVLDAYATGPGLAELLEGHTGLAGVGAAILSTEAPANVEAALAPTGDGVEAWVRLNGTTAAHASFKPTLAAHLPADTTWVAQMPSLTGSAPGLLSVLASASSFGSGTSAVSSLVDKLGPALQAEGVATGPLQSLFDHPSAIFSLDGGLGVMTTTRDAKAARLHLGNAGQALAALFAASNGDAGTSSPFVTTGSEHDVAVTTYTEGTASQLDLAVFDGVIVITTSQAAMDAIIDQKKSLAGSDLYQSVLTPASRSAGPVLFGAMDRLVRRGGAAGLLQSLGLEGTTRTLAQISAAGLTSTSAGTQTTAELFFTIS